MIKSSYHVFKSLYSPSEGVKPKEMEKADVLRILSLRVLKEKRASQIHQFNGNSIKPNTGVDVSHNHFMKSKHKKITLCQSVTVT